MTRFRIVDLGCDEESYFPGHGVAFSPYTESVVGMGDTAKEALDDALEQMAMSDAPEGLVEAVAGSGSFTTLAADTETVMERVGCACPPGEIDGSEQCAVCAGTYHRYVAIDWRC